MNSTSLCCNVPIFINCRFPHVYQSISIASVIFGSLFTAFAVGNAMVRSFHEAVPGFCQQLSLFLLCSITGHYLLIRFTFNHRKCDGRCTSLCQLQKIRGCRCTILHASNLKFSETMSVNLSPKTVRSCVLRPSLRANNSPRKFIRAMTVCIILFVPVVSNITIVFLNSSDELGCLHRLS